MESLLLLLPPENPPPDPGLLFPEDDPHGPSRAKILNLFLITIQYM